MILRKRLKSLRKSNNLTQNQVADDLFISRSAYCSYERESRCPSFETLFALADYFGVSLDYLLGRTDIPCSPVFLNEKQSAILRALPDLPEPIIELVLMAILLAN